MDKYKIIAVIVTFNRKLYVIECIKRILHQVEYSCDILVVDNGSSDGTKEEIQKISSPSIIYINTRKNLGGAGGFFWGINYACKLGYNYVWLMDDDTFVEATALKHLVLADRELKDNYGWLSSRVLWIDGQDCEMNIQRSSPYKKIRFYNKNLIPSAMASFVSLFIPVKNIDKYGLPIKEFFIWTDDWEFTRRISRNEKCYTVKNSQVIHAMKHHLPVNIAVDSEERLPRYNYYYRNDVYLYRREGFIGWIWVFIKFLWHTIQVILKSNNKTKKIIIIWKGFYYGIKFKPKIKFPSCLFSDET